MQNYYEITRDSPELSFLHLILSVWCIQCKTCLFLCSELEWMLSEVGVVKTDLEAPPKREIHDVMDSALRQSGLNNDDSDEDDWWAPECDCEGNVIYWESKEQSECDRGEIGKIKTMEAGLRAWYRKCVSKQNIKCVLNIWYSLVWFQRMILHWVWRKTRCLWFFYLLIITTCTLVKIYSIFETDEFIAPNIIQFAIKY